MTRSTVLMVEVHPRAVITKRTSSIFEVCKCKFVLDERRCDERLLRCVLADTSSFWLSLRHRGVVRHRAMVCSAGNCTHV